MGTPSLGPGELHLWRVFVGVRGLGCGSRCCWHISTWLVWLKLAPGLPGFCPRNTFAELLGMTWGPGGEQKLRLGVTGVVSGFQSMRAAVRSSNFSKLRMFQKCHDSKMSRATEACVRFWVHAPTATRQAPSAPWVPGGGSAGILGRPSVISRRGEGLHFSSGVQQTALQVTCLLFPLVRGAQRP